MWLSFQVVLRIFLVWSSCPHPVRKCYCWFIVSIYLISLQFYTFLETSLVTLSLLPHFIAFFSDTEIPGTPGTLATTFLAFGSIQLPIFLNHVICCICIFHNQQLWLCFSVLNLAFALSVLGFLIMHISLVAANTTTIEVLAIPEHAYLICSCVSSQFAKRPFLMARIQI